MAKQSMTFDQQFERMFGAPTDDDEYGDDESDQGEYDTAPDWEGECDVCGACPGVPETGLCGPCTFGDASTVGGNW